MMLPAKPALVAGQMLVVDPELAIAV